MIKNAKKIFAVTAKVTRRVLSFKKHRVLSMWLFASFVVVGFSLSGTAVFGWVEEAVSISAYVLAWLASVASVIFMKMAIFFLRFFIQLASYNGFLDSEVVKVGWVMVRDVANMVFVVALLVIAFATILGRESYEWTKLMAKLVLAAIFVNFSALLCGLMIDAAHIFTVTFLNAIVPIAGGNLISMFKLPQISAMVNPGESVGGHGPLDINKEVFMGAMFSAMMAGMVMVIMLAYSGIMLFRTVFLWILIILSP